MESSPGIAIIIILEERVEQLSTNTSDGSGVPVRFDLKAVQAARAIVYSSA
jgi:hypothetical protein